MAAGAEGDEEAGGCVSFEVDTGRGGEESEEAGLGGGRVSSGGQKGRDMLVWETGDRIGIGVGNWRVGFKGDNLKGLIE